MCVSDQSLVDLRDRNTSLAAHTSDLKGLHIEQALEKIDRILEASFLKAGKIYSWNVKS